MFKYFNCFFSSFFRTLGRIIVYILLGLVFSTILSKIDVHADSLDMKVSLNGDYSIQTWFANGRNNTLSIYSNYSENQLLYDMSQAPQYGYVMMCSDAKITSSYSSNPNNITNIRIENTNIPCDQGTMLGTIQYVLFNTPEWACSVQGNNCTFGYSLVFYQESSSNYYIMESQFVDSQISVDLSSGYLINQNQQIINQNQQIINGQNNIINNQNNNTDKVIDNQNNNTDKTIQNQNENTDKQIDSQKVCQEIGRNSGKIPNKVLDKNGKEVFSDSYSITDYYYIFGGSLENIIPVPNASSYSWFYDVNKNLISGFANSLTGNIDIPNNAYYVRFSIKPSNDMPTFKICQSGNQVISGGLNDINGSINNSDTTEATNDANNFFNNFTTDLHGLTGIITAPLNAINSLTNKTCSPLILPLPFVDKNLTLPCMRSIYDEHFGAFMTLYDTITFGIVSYWVCVRIFSFVKDFKNPEHDEIEVVDL